jgi:hypothetical protein
VWSSWDLDEPAARDLAAKLVDTRYAAGVTQCSGGCGGECREDLIAIDVLTNQVRARA